ncbi:MAG: hypothetical protein QG657_5596, partial [Acidobacteriota bacterium]|nr:hypothetical protein [Acidobacteriota bacterium]
MKMKNKHIVLSVFVFFIFNFFALNPFLKSNHSKPGSGLYGQDVDLVKLKQEEEERKKKTKKSKYVVTNDNLDKIETPNKPYGIIKVGGKSTEKGKETAGGDTGTQNQPVIEDNTPPAPDAKADDAGSDGGDRQSKQYWQDRVNKLLDDIEATQADIKDSRQELSLLNGDLQNEDLYEKRLEIQKKLEELKKHIPEAEQKLADLNKAMEDLEDQARKESIPAGWLR